MSETEQTRVHLWVKGRVQGVGFRAFVQHNAVALGITGWVRNLGWNTVETVAEGPKAQITQFIALVKSGPRASRVEESNLEWETPTGEFRTFEIRASR